MELKTPFVGAMKIARNVPASGRLDEWYSPHPSSLPEGVSPVEWWNVKTFEFRRGDENRPQPRTLASTPMNGTHPFPAPSLRELLSAAKLRECRPMVAPGRWFIHRVLLALKFLSFYVHRGTLPQSRIRSTAPSEREPGMGAHHSTCRPEAGTFRAIFIAPTGLRVFYVPPVIGGVLRLWHIYSV